MIGVFVPWDDRIVKPGRPGTAGWIIDGNGCHIWAGALRNGYGMVRINRIAYYAHRVRYEREVGPIPDGMELDHFVCERRECCNPRHVRPVSHRENVLRADRGMGSLNASKTHCPKGHPLSGDNLDSYTAKRGWRKCRLCHNERQRSGK